MNIKIITDSTAYIPAALLEEFSIQVISLNIVQLDVSQREVAIDESTFYEHLSKSDALPTSSQPIPEEMLNAFEEVVKKGDIAVGIFLSSDMSGTYNSAHLIRNMLLEKYPSCEIHLVDSRSNCMQMGFSVLEAARLVHEGKSITEVLEGIEKVIHNSRFLFTPETLEYLKKGGRIGTASALLGNLLQIRPILTVVDGKTTVFSKVRTHKKAVQTMVDTLLLDLKGKTLGGVIVHHIHNEVGGKELASQLEKLLGIPIAIQSIGPVIGLHVGPGSIGLAYYTK